MLSSERAFEMRHSEHAACDPMQIVSQGPGHFLLCSGSFKAHTHTHTLDSDVHLKEPQQQEIIILMNMEGPSQEVWVCVCVGGCVSG